MLSRKPSWTGVALALAVGVPPAPAQPTGPIFDLSEHTASSPQVAAISSGTFAVVSHAPGFAGSRLVARVFNEQFEPISIGTLVNEPAHSASSPSVAAIGDGFVVAYQRVDYSPILSGARVVLRQIDALGNIIGTEIEVAPGSEKSQEDPRISLVASGKGFLVTWEDRRSAGEFDGTRGRWINEELEPTGSDFLVSPTYFTSAIALPNGGLMASWPIGNRVFARAFDNSGSPATEEFQISAETTAPAVGFVSAVQSGPSEILAMWPVGGNPPRLAARRFDLEGNLIGPEFSPASRDYAEVGRISLTALQGYGFLASWSGRLRDTAFYYVFARAYDSQFRPNGPDLTVNTVQQNLGAPSVAALPNGRGVITWAARRTSNTSSVFGRLFNTNLATPSASPTVTPTSTHTPLPTPTESPSPTHSPCVGDCNRDGRVTIEELILSVTISLGRGPVATCSASDVNGDRRITINELVAAVRGALLGCSA